MDSGEVSSREGSMCSYGSKDDPHPEGPVQGAQYPRQGSPSRRQNRPPQGNQGPDQGEAKGADSPPPAAVGSKEKSATPDPVKPKFGTIEMKRPNPDYRDRDFETNTSYTTMQGYVRSVRPDHVRSHARSILEAVDPGRCRYNYAAALTEHVHDVVDYNPNSDLWRADYVLDHTQEGDCEDFATLLASLMVCRSFPIQFVVVRHRSDDAGHVMLEVGFDTDDIESLRTAATDWYDTELDTLAWEPRENGGYWLLCNPTTSPHVGTTRTGYCRVRPSGELRWRHGVLTDYLTPYATL